jgi:hypothetical protein
MAMNYNEWPVYVRKRFALNRTLIGENVPPVDPREPAQVSAGSVVEWLYGLLGVLDGKASALMRLNGVLIAAAAFLLGLFGRGEKTLLEVTPMHAILIVLSAAGSALSIFACLWVVNVSWPFLHKVPVPDKESVARSDCKQEIIGLAKACLHRACAYRCAWGVSLVASAMFVFEFMWQAIFVLSNGGQLVGVKQ